MRAQLPNILAAFKHNWLVSQFDTFKSGKKSSWARTDTTPEAHMDLLARWRVDAQNTHWSRWTPELLAAARERGLLAFGSIAQLPHQMERALGKGLDGLYTDHVRDLVRVARDLGIETIP